MTKGRYFHCLWLLVVVIIPVRAQQAGELWGMAYSGGHDGVGVVFKTDADGKNQSVQNYFSSLCPGAFPQRTQLIQAANGKMYGVTTSGGAGNFGELFEFDPTTKTYSRKFDFDYKVNGAYPYGSLTQALNGKLYGMTSNGGAGLGGVLFEFDPSTGAFTKKLDFNGLDNGAYPYGSLTQASDGKLYGMTYGGGTNNFGIIFSYDPATSILSKELDFDGSISGAYPYGSLVQAANGKLYGMTFNGGANNKGVLFEFDPVTTTCTNKVNFNGSNGASPYGSLIQATSNGKLYGMTSAGGVNNLGMLFEYNIATSDFVAKMNFNGSSNGASPQGDLMEASNGKLYGMTGYGGANGDGAFLEYDPATNTCVKKIDFAYYVTGANPFGGLIESNGALYGMTSNGGAYYFGVLFAYDMASSAYAKDLDFSGSVNGAYPEGNLVQASNGKLYGMTASGGSKSLGVLFEYDPASGIYSKKQDFDGSTGAYPSGSLVQAPNGKLYGMTTNGGNNNFGILFEYEPYGNLVKKVDFDWSVGAYPYGGLTVANNGKLYGMTSQGGVNGNGVLFEFDPATGLIAKKMDFNGTLSGANPYGNVTQAANGKLYGMTLHGGVNDDGVIFEYDLITSAYTKKLDFSAALNGSDPYGGLAQLPSNGKLYGMTSKGGANDLGLLFSIDPTTGAFNKEFDFTGTDNGAKPQGTLIQSASGKLYGMTTYGGANSNQGVLFEYDPVTKIYTKRTDFNWDNGANPTYGQLIIFRSPQTITFNPLTQKTYGDAPFALTATVSSGLTASFVSSDTTVAKINGTTVTLLKGGTVTITAIQNGNINFLPAPAVQQTLIAKANQTITFYALTSKTVGDASFNLTATATSGLPINYTASSNKVTLNGNIVTLVSAGRDTIVAHQPGNSEFYAATPTWQSFCVQPAKPVITITNPNTESPTLYSSAASGNQWFLDGEAIAGAHGTSITVTTSGTYKVQATVDDCVSTFSNDQPVIITGELTQLPDAIALFPNPAHDVIILKGFAHEEVDESFVIDLVGRYSAVKLYADQGFLKADVSTIPSGLYVFEIRGKNSIRQIRFVKQ